MSIKNYIKKKYKNNKKKTLKKLKNLKVNNNINIMGYGKKEIMNYKDKFIEILKEFEYYNREHKKDKNSKFTVNAYKNAIEGIKSIEEINSTDDIKNIPGIGKGIINKLDEFIKTNKVEELEKFRIDYGEEGISGFNKYKRMDIFLDIPEFGPAIAKKLVDMDIKNIEELKMRQDEKIDGKGKKKLDLLNKAQKDGLKYYLEILERIPRTEIEEYKKIFLETFIKVSNNDIENNKFEIAGSYRRGKEESGDIDIIITSRKNDISVFTSFVDELKKQNIFVSFLSDGPVKKRVIGKLNEKSRARRIDLLYSPPEEYAFSILYFTGSKDFNTAMRTHALSNGLTLNEHGFSKMENKKKGEKVLTPIFNTEKDIFDYLNLEFKEPHERIDETSIIEKKTKEIEPKEIEPKEVEKKEIEPKEMVPKEVEVKETEEKLLKIKNSKTKLENTKNKTIKNTKKESKKKALDNIKKFKSEGISVLESLSEEELTIMLKEAIQTYYQESKEPLLIDNQYDILREHILKKYPNNKTALEQHTEIKLDKNKVKLPYEMWSMDKIKPDTKELDKFKKNYDGPYVISCKLDGVSALYSTEEETPHLYTRGDGKYGQSIDRLIPHLKLPKVENITLRGELIIKEKLFQDKYSGQFSNSRNFISGIVNKKKLLDKDIEIIKDIDFVAYEVIKPEGLEPSKQFKFLEENKDSTNIVKYLSNISKEELTNEFLSEKLLEWRTEYEYMIDGIICINDKAYPRPKQNPEYAFAFKMILSGQEAEAKVLDVLWTASKDGLLKPRVQIEPVTLEGATINYATGFNGKFIKDKTIGVGTIIRLVRSGGVIPHIVEVIDGTSPLMPKEDYVWSESGVDIILVNKKDNNAVKVKEIHGFFKELEVEGLGETNVKKVFDIGANSIPKILALSIEDLQKVENFGEKMATKVYNSIKRQIEKAELPKLAGASNIFGRGFKETRVELILNEYPDILTSSETDKIKLEKVKKVDGIADKTGKQFVDNIKNFIKFLKDSNLEYKLTTKEPKESKKESKEKPKEVKEESKKSEILKDKIILMSDFKSAIFTKKELQERIESMSGKVANSFSSNVNILIVGSLDVESGKINKAKEYNTKAEKKNIPLIEIISADDFIKKYSINK